MRALILPQLMLLLLGLVWQLESECDVMRGRCTREDVAFGIPALV